MPDTTTDPNRRPRTAHVLGDVVIARRHLTENGQDDAADGDRAEHLLDTVTEVIATDDDARLRALLVEVASAAVAWVEAIDERAEATR